MSGANSYYGGLAAEDGVARHYERHGHRIAERRWRTGAGEIDLIAEKDGNVVFVEVKKSRTHARAAERLGRRQIDRITRSAEVYLGTLKDGLNSFARFDVALVDGGGRIEVIENVLCA